jgi:nucleotide-binding universal stress UspA family protein
MAEIALTITCDLTGGNSGMSAFARHRRSRAWICIRFIRHQTAPRASGVKEADVNRLDLRYIACPIDFSTASSESLATGGAIARARDAELRTMHVIPTEGAADPEGIGSLEHQSFMTRLRAALSDAAPGYERKGAAVRQGDPATQILRWARLMPADLIVIGAPGAEPPTGPVASVVVARSQCSVLTVPAHPCNGGPKDTGLFARIVCAVDLTPSAAGVIRQAISLGWETNAQLSVVCVAGKDTGTKPSAIREGLLAAIPADAGSWCKTDVIVTTGVASDEIVRIAADLDADVVVIGAPRRSMSTTYAVVSHSRCPVLVPQDARPLPWPVAQTPAAPASVRS